MPNSEILGIKPLVDNFGRLSEGMERRVARRMVVAAGGLLKREAKKNIKADGLVKTGAFEKNVVIKRETKKPEGTEQFNLGVRHGPNLTKKQKANHRLAVNRKGRIVKKYEDDPWYWIFQEFGTKHISAKRPIQKAFDQNIQPAIDAMGEALNKEIEKDIKK